MIFGIEANDDANQRFEILLNIQAEVAGSAITN
jgi:hypothetical protein